MRDYYVPVTELLNVEYTATMDEIKNGSFLILPLENVELPQKALSVDGLYPGDNHYPLKEELVLALKMEKDIPEKLKEWFFSIPSLPEEKILVSISAVGDIMIGENASEILLEDGGVEDFFGETDPLLSNPDFTIGNLEGCVSTRGEPVPKFYHFRFKPEILAVLKEAGFDYLSLTNNHAYDYGETAFKDTLDNLNKYNIDTSGAGYTVDEAKLPFIIQIGDEKILIHSIAAFPDERDLFCGERDASVTEDRAGYLWANEEGFETLKQSFSADSFNIVNIHCGYGGVDIVYDLPNTDQKTILKKIADLGADLILGTHPHGFQPIEVYQSSLIAYSLGNFMFIRLWESYKAYETVILTIRLFNGVIRYVEFTPVRIYDDRLEIDTDGTILERFIEINLKFRE